MNIVEEYKNKVCGVCATCEHLVQLNDRNLIGCEAHGKFILPQFPPYHDNKKCIDWERR